MTKDVLAEYSNGQIDLSDKLKAKITDTREDFNLWKIKIFSNSGETIYSSTAEDIGKLNTKPYFHDIVAKGKTHTKVVKKNSKSLEDQIVSRDVVETYIPILNQGEFIGAFELYYDITDRRTLMDHLISDYSFLLQLFTITTLLIVLFASVTLRNSIKRQRELEEALIQQAEIDKMTGIYNRRKFEELLQWNIQIFDRYKNNTSILLLDIDHFKEVNDSFGHHVGDEVLIAVVDACIKSLRKSDIIGRYGGEEFIAMLPLTPPEEAFIVAEKLRQSIASTPIPTKQGSIDVTVSIGIAHFGDIVDLSLDSITMQADDRLYQAKKQGRNQTVSAQPNA
ncbi:MAG: GGDEF domain-containing protein [Gammaproteobacteria bacterium]|nr:GGDEF domain-containing protein [Gammaproteobacteria bacterium]